MIAEVRLRPLSSQTTLGAAFSLSGIGMHTGQPATVTVQPALANEGIRFACRSEESRPAVEFSALAASVVNTRRCTCLGTNVARLDTVEHLLSALAGMQVDNARVEVLGEELPILDGSGRPWIEAIRAVGVVELSESLSRFRLSAPIALKDGESWLVATPAESFCLTCVTHFDHPLLGTQAATFFDDPEAYAAEIAPARTFGFAHEVEALLAAGLAKGGSLDNALIVHEDRFSDALRVPEECLRHKVLDLWGDLSLFGGRIGRLDAALTAVKPGHRINAAFAALLAEHVSEYLPEHLPD